MSQKIIIAVLGLIIVAGGGFWYYQNNMNDDGTNKLGGSNTKSTEEKGLFETLGDTVSGSFSEIIGSGDSVQCTFSGIDPETNESSEGVIYMDGENYRMEANTVIEGTEAEINVIQNGSVMYMWSDNEEAMPAIKIDVSMFPEDKDAPAESPIDWLKDPEAGVDYKCRDWSPKSNSFTPPEDIEFVDMFAGMGAMLEGMMGGGEEGGMGMFGGMMESEVEGEASVEGNTEGVDDWQEPSY